MRARLRRESGFGLVELLISMTILSIALLALVAGLNASLLALDRAGATSTAETLADTQMERYRALKYCSIRLDDASVPASPSPPYTTDAAYSASQVLDTQACAGTTPTCPAGPPVECMASRTLTGPDQRRYRVDTYIVYATPAGGRPLKVVTVVVRDVRNLAGAPLVRLQSRFDETTGR